MLQHQGIAKMMLECLGLHKSPGEAKLDLFIIKRRHIYFYRKCERSIQAKQYALIIKIPQCYLIGVSTIFYLHCLEISRDMQPPEFLDRRIDTGIGRLCFILGMVAGGFKLELVKNIKSRPFRWCAGDRKACQL